MAEYPKRTPEGNQVPIAQRTPHHQWSDILRALKLYTSAMQMGRTNRNFYYILISPKHYQTHNAFAKQTETELTNFMADIKEYADLLKQDRNVCALVTLPVEFGNSWDFISFDTNNNPLRTRRRKQGEEKDRSWSRESLEQDPKNCLLSPVSISRSRTRQT